MGAALYLCSFFQTPMRADYFRWMSVALVVVFSSVGLLHASWLAVRYCIYRWKNRDTLS